MNGNKKEKLNENNTNISNKEGNNIINKEYIEKKISPPIINTIPLNINMEKNNSPSPIINLNR